MTCQKIANFHVVCATQQHVYTGALVHEGHKKAADALSYYSQVA